MRERGLNIPGLSNFFFLSNKFGNAKNQLREIDSLYASKKQIAISPVGRTTRVRNNILCDEPWSSSFIRKAKKHNRSIVPMHVSGRNTNLFYQIWKWRNRFRIGINFEMFLLIKELFNMRGKTITLTFGDEIKPSSSPKNTRNHNPPYFDFSLKRI